MRNAIVHLKTVSYPQSQEINASPDSIWYRLLSPQQGNHPLDAKKLVLHFADRETTHWLKYCPF